jgi:hypothetical protein
MHSKTQHSSFSFSRKKQNNNTKNATSISFQQLLSLKTSKKLENKSDDIGNSDYETNNYSTFYCYEIQSMRNRWNIKRTLSDFQTLSNTLSGSFQPLPKDVDSNEVPFETKSKLLSKWISALFWLMKGRSVKNAERFHPREDKNMDVVLDFLCNKEEEPPQEKVIKSKALKSDAVNTECIEPTSKNNHANENLKTTSHKSKKTTFRLSTKYKSKKVDRVKTLSDLAEIPLNISPDGTNEDDSDKTRPQRIRKITHKKKIIPPPPPPLPVQSTLGINEKNNRIKEQGKEEDEEDSLESFESVIASIVPQIVSEQVSKMRIVEKKQYEVLEKKHKSMLTKSRKARKEMEEHYAKQLEEAEDENEKLRLKLKVNENHVIELKQQIKNAMRDKEVNVLRQQEQEQEIKNLECKIQLLNAQTRSIMSERDEALALAVKSNRDVALLEEAKLRETTLRQLAHSAQETAEGDMHRQKMLVEKHRKAQKLAEGRLQMYNLVEERLNTLVEHGELNEKQLKWLLESKVITPLLNSKTVKADKADKLDNDDLHLDSHIKEKHDTKQSSSPSSSALPYSKLKNTKTYKFYNNNTNKKRQSNIKHANGTMANKSAVDNPLDTTSRDKYMSSRIKRMSVNDLRNLLDKYKVPHKDCIEKGELIFRAQQAIHADETVRRKRFANSNNMGKRAKKSPFLPKPCVGSFFYSSSSSTASMQDQSNLQKDPVDENSEHPSSSSSSNPKEPAYETLNEPPLSAPGRKNEAILNAFQNMVEPPPPPPPQASAPHPYVKVNNKHQNTFATEGDSHNNSSSNIINTSVEVNDIHYEEVEKQEELSERVTDDELELLSSASSTSNIENNATNPEEIFVSSNSNNILNDPQILMKIKRRKSQEEFETQQRASARVQRLKSAELEKEKMEIATQRHHSHIERKVKKWAKGKSLIRMLTTMHIILPSRAPKLTLNLRSTANDVKVAYKKALRAVHPDKLVGAKISDRMKAEQVFKALRDAYALDMQVAGEIERKEKESINRTNAYYRLSKKFGLNINGQKNSYNGTSARHYRPNTSKAYHSQRWG